MGTSVARHPDEEHYGPAVRAMKFERGTDGPRVVMVGVDGTETSLRAAASAFGVARRQGCGLTMVFVAAPGLLASLAPQVGYAQQEAFEEVAAELRAEAHRAAEEYGVPITLVTRRGDAFSELAAVADSIKADFVFVGASAQAGHRFVGSIATRLVRLAHWPVVVVP
ncbi:universal stress protein A [Asanoa ishikariensis]|uniref:Nucleotide-binding universal stress protein, UspA family n=1 Tax=Asanoa ishikariensis TaxID=137265 RepID=A0A1H3TA22_9ACTN|nr:universal stress protein [Asanoa ishikariensis]GIF62843.1 universal stress protein A [Asanoa ishikariensis]SDZ46701.1 Nucleotide-binding universal stress protein, UspA family [Asanoa ishikariensis]